MHCKTKYKVDHMQSKHHVDEDYEGIHKNRFILEQINSCY